MRLLWVSVHGFKAYKEKVVINLHPGANAVIGLNGSGKSSLLEAITLVVSEIYGRRVVDVKSIFHHGVRNASLSATIELCFDNRDRRLAMYDDDEVILSRRFISGSAQARKDQFLVMNKVVTKQEFSSILENGGFSKTNPYYVIRQGKIIEMATMTDEGRMKLLKDFSGVQVYEDKRQQAVSTLAMAQQKAHDADLLIQNLQSRLSELEEQHREVCEYENLVRLANVYRVVVNDLDLANLDIQINTIQDEIKQVDMELVATQDQLINEQDELQGNLQLVNTSHDLIDEYHDQLITTQTQLKIARDKEKAFGQIVNKMDSSKSVYVKKIAKLRDNLNNNKKQITDLQINLDQDISPETIRLQKSLENLNVQLSDTNFNQQNISAKIERCSQFKNVQERNQHLSKQIAQIEKKIEQERKNIQQYSRSLESTRQSLQTLIQSNPHQDLINLEEQQTNLTLKAHELSRHRSELVRKEENLQMQLRSLRKQNDSKPKLEALSALQKACRWATWRGNLTALTWAFGRQDELGVYEAMVSKVCEYMDKEYDVLQPPRMDDPSVFGPLWALLSVPPQYRKACTQAIGVQMDNLIVWNDEIASHIFSQLKKGQGSTTITPLNQIVKRGSIKFPTYPSNVCLEECDEIDFKKYDAIPLTKLIKCPPFVKPALDAITSRWLVVKNLDTGRKICQNCDVDCVTLDGDKVTYKGSVQGGFLSSSDIFSLGEEFGRVIKVGEEKSYRMKMLQSEIDQVVIERSKCSTEFQKLTEQLHEHEQEKMKIEMTKTTMSRQKEELNLKVKSWEHKIELSQSHIRAMDQSISDMRQISLSNELEKITDEDKKVIRKLTKQEEKLKAELNIVKENINNHERLKKTVLMEITELENLVKTDQDELNQILSHHSADGDEEYQRQQLLDAKKLRIQLTQTEEELNENLKAAQIRLDKINHSVNKIKERVDQLTDRIDTLTQSKELAAKKKDLLELKRAQQTSSRQNMILQAAQTDEQIEALKRMPPQQLRAELRDVEVKLSKAPKVNQKALGDLITFQSELNAKVAQRAELVDGLKSVQELMVALNERRSRTLRNQFDKVNANLQIVFGKIVPGGRAKLVIKKLSEDKIEALRQARKSNLALMDATPSDSSQAWQLDLGRTDFGGDVLHWDEIASGIEVKASFRPAVDAPTEYFPLVALSGGQKTIVALSLIFAMQRCDKAPFYVLDEADAALDEAYRSAVAKLIQESAQDSQFLITTFRRELCEICDKHFHVTNVDRVAHVEETDVQTALRVILEDAEKTAVAIEVSQAA